MALYFFCGTESGLHDRNHFIEISCNEVEHSRSPKIVIEGSVENVLRNSVAKHIFVEIKGDELLNLTKGS